MDYRELNKVTVRKFFLIPNSDYIKSTVAGNSLISVGDLKEGFNQVDNEEETKKKMAVLSAGGCWLPRGLTFGPTNGPEDFQELVFTVFGRRLYKDWFLFVDDLSVATGRPKCHGEGPSGAHDVISNIREETEGERGVVGRSVRSGAAFPSPFAHVVSSWWLYLMSLLAWIASVCSFDYGRKQKEKKITSTYSSATSIHEELRGPLSPRELKPPSRHSPPRVCTLHVPGARMLITCFVMLYSVQPSFSRKQGTLRATDHGLLADCSSGKMMQAPCRKPDWYDPERKLQVPTQPWTAGDLPRADRVHLDIYVSGHAYKGSAWNPRANNGRGGWRHLHGVIDVDKESSIDFAIEDVRELKLS